MTICHEPLGRYLATCRCSVHVCHMHALANTWTAFMQHLRPAQHQTLALCHHVTNRKVSTTGQWESEAPLRTLLSTCNHHSMEEPEYISVNSRCTILAPTFGPCICKLQEHTSSLATALPSTSILQNPPAPRHQSAGYMAEAYLPHTPLKDSRCSAAVIAVCWWRGAHMACCM